MKRSVFSIIFVVLCCVALVGNGYAATYEGHDYQLTSPGLTWLQAEAEAVTAGGHLVTINSEAEEIWLLDNFNPRFWIGFTDQAVEGTLRGFQVNPLPIHTGIVESQITRVAVRITRK